MAVITKELALKIVKKLKAKVVTRAKPHDIALVNHEGKMVASFGIRRGSRKDQGHDHIPHQIFLRPRQARKLGLCPMSREEWISIITEKGKVCSPFGTGLRPSEIQL